MSLLTDIILPLTDMRWWINTGLAVIVVDLLVDGHVSNVGVAFSFLTAPLVEEVDDEAMDTDAPAINGK
jgi:hypothetical protein